VSTRRTTTCSVSCQAWAVLPTPTKRQTIWFTRNIKNSYSRFYIILNNQNNMTAKS
jgi:hypothetical protein